MGLGRLLYEATAGTMRLVSRLRPTELMVDGAPVPALTGGRGPRLLLVHGFTADKESWLPLTTYLGRHFSMAAIDLPGFGAAVEHDPANATNARMADHVASVLDALGWDQAHVCAHSMGGAVSIDLARRHPKRARSLSLISPAGPLVAPSDFDEALDGGDNPIIVRTQEAFARMMTFVAARPPPFPRAVWRHIGAQQIARADRHEAVFAVWFPDHRARGWGTDVLSEVRAPTLVLTGTLDRIVDPSTARALADAIPGARYEELEGIGHSAQFEVPRATAKLIRRFVAEH